MGQRQNLFLILAILVVSVYLYVISSSSTVSSTILSSRIPKTTPRTGSSNNLRSWSTNEQQQQQQQQQQHRTKECTIYVAPSSLKGNPGYGLYTTRNLWKDEPILGGPDGVAIPIEAYSQTNNIPKGRMKRQWIRLWNPYWWGRGVPDHVAFEAGPDFVDYQIGFGFLPNHHCILRSITSRYPAEYPYDDSLVNRFESPGAGAFSYNIGREFTSTRDVMAGEELFMSYGYCTHGKGPEWTNDIYMPSEFQTASDIIWDRIGPDAKQSFEFDQQGNLRLDTIAMEDSEQTHPDLVQQLLPANPKDLQTLKAAPLTRDKLPTYLAQTKGVIRRTTDWIKQNGMCVETLVHGKSTIPDAGQGAFAQHAIPKGTLATFAPLLHIMDQDVLAIYNNDDEDNQVRVGTQLLLNYCFANPHSTLLLCPTTNAVLINHCSNRRPQQQNLCPGGPNVDYRWSSGWDKTSDEWRAQSFEELAAKTYRGLSLEIYALRDIAPGEEVYMDYGIEWEQAWDEHVRNWKPPPRPATKWITAKDANERGGSILKELMSTPGNVKDVVDHPYLMTGCVYWPTSDDSHEAYQNKNPEWITWDTQKVLDQYSDDGRQFTYTDSEQGYSNHYDGLHWPCSVLWKERDGTYTVRIHQNPTADAYPWEMNGVPRILFAYPRKSIRYFVKPYASDQHLPGVFRHPIGMRDEIFPSQWMNRKQG